MKQGADAVSRETHDRLTVFVDLLRRWNTRINLISRHDEELVWSRHIEDSLQLLSVLPAGHLSACDLGSGAGFPGLVLALAANIEFTLVEADARKAAFLNEAVRMTGAPAIVRNARVEELPAGPAAIITARAFAPLLRLMNISSHLIGPSTILLLLKGRDAGREVAEAGRYWKMDITSIPAAPGSDGTILRIEGISHA